MVKNISSLIHLIDPLSGQTASMNPEGFWSDPIRPLITAARARMTKYIVLGKEPVVSERNVSKRTTTRKQKNRLATLCIAREADLGVNDKQSEERSNVGYLMKAGDVCVGYDLTETQFVDDAAEDMRSAGKLPDVIVIRKLYGAVATGEADAAQKRIWRMQRLDVKVAETTKSARAAKEEAEKDGMDEEDFMREVEADKGMRSQMNLYKSEQVSAKKPEAEDTEMADDDDNDEDDQEVQLEELLDGLVMNSGPDPDDDVGEEVEVFGYEEGDKAAKDGIKYVGREESRQMEEKESAVPKSSFGKEYDAKDFKFM
jgi:nonsense-mediated mRNA decay protein 3